MAERLVGTRSAEHDGDEPAVAGERAAIERPLQQAPGESEHWKRERNALRVLEVAGVDRLVLKGDERHREGGEAWQRVQQRGGVVGRTGDNHVAERAGVRIESEGGLLANDRADRGA